MNNKFVGKTFAGKWLCGYYCVWEDRHYIAPNPVAHGFVYAEHDISGWIRVEPKSVSRDNSSVDYRTRRCNTKGCRNMASYKNRRICCSCMSKHNYKYRQKAGQKKVRKDLEQEAENEAVNRSAPVVPHS